MNASTGSKPSADKPTPLSPAELSTIATALPAGATILGGLKLSAERSEYVASTFPTEIDTGGCVIVFWGADDHTIHRTELCQVKADHYEIGSDTVVGTW